MPESKSTAAAPWPWLPAPVGLLLIAVVACAAYWPALNGSLLWDDDYNITSPELRSLDGLRRIWFEIGATQQYYPLLHSSFWVQHRLWGDQMLGYHLVNLCLHLLATILVYAVVRKLRIPGALLAAAIFALHPVHVETVAWVTEQKNTLSTVFYLGAMLAYLHFDQSRREKTYFLALVLFACALFSKTATVTLPPALLVILWWSRSRDPEALAGQRGTLSGKRDVVPLVPFFMLAVIAGAVTVYVERNFLNAKGDQFELSIAQRVLVAGRAVWFYAGKLVWPTNLIFQYPRWDVDPTQWWQWLYPASVMVVLVALWINRLRTPGILAGCLLFIGTLLPTLGFVDLVSFRFSFVQDHLQYLASLGPIVLAAAGATTVLARLPEQVARLGGIFLFLPLAVLAALSHEQSKAYQNAITLYQTTLARNPESWLAHNNLGIELRKLGQSDAAIDHFRQAAELNPKDWDSPYNMGTTLAQTGRPQEAIAAFEQALQRWPRFVQAIANLGAVYLNAGQFQQANQYLELAVAIEPTHAEAQTNLGVVLFQLGQPEPGLQHLSEAVRLDPGSGQAQGNLGSALFVQGSFQQAIDHLERATKLKPDDANTWAALAQSYAQLKRSTEAFAAAHRALELARSQGKATLAREIESWTAGEGNSPAGAVPNSSLPPAPATP